MGIERLPGESLGQRHHWAVRVVDSRGGGSFVPKICRGEGEAKIWSGKNHVPGGYLSEPHQITPGEVYSVDGMQVEHGKVGKGGDNLAHDSGNVSPRPIKDQEPF